MVRNMELEDSNGLMVLYTQESLGLIIFMGRELTYGQMVVALKGAGSIIKGVIKNIYNLERDMAIIDGLMENYIVGSSLMIKRVDLEFYNLQMARGMKEIG